MSEAFIVFSNRNLSSTSTGQTRTIVIDRTAWEFLGQPIPATQRRAFHAWCWGFVRWSLELVGILLFQMGNFHLKYIHMFMYRLMLNIGISKN